MTDDAHTEEPGTDTGATVAEQTPVVVGETPAEAETPEAEESKKLRQTVEMKDIGPCKKHVKVTVNREDIDGRLEEQFSKLVVEANVSGFRPGKAPRKVIERRYHKEVSDQVKGEVLMASLEQLSEDYEISPLSTPNLDPLKIEIPKEGPMIYEFEVEVRPEFDLPEYKGLKLRRPVRTFTDADVAKEEKRILAPYAQVVPKPEGDAQEGDVLVSDVTTRYGGHVLSTHKEFAVRVDARLAFKDGMAERFAEEVQGAKAGDTRTVNITLSNNVAEPNLQGRTVEATFEVKEVKSLRMPELTHEFLHNYGVHTPEQFRELIHVVLERRLEYTQRQAARQQVLEKIVAASGWELPRDLLARQARTAMARRVMEMRSNGMSEEEIRGRQRVLEQDILQSTAQALKEHFVLQKVAEVEKLDVEEEDIDLEIERIADQNNESPRRVRARIEKDDLLDALAADIIERKALDLILGSAEYEDVPLDQQADSTVATVEQQAVPGEMQDPTALPPESSEPKAEEKTESTPATQS